MEMKHFSHHHSLSLVEVQQQKKKYEDRELICYGCLESILSENFAYCCTQHNCKGTFFLHKSCAELPLEISHPEHQEHSLILHHRPIYQVIGCGCDIDSCTCDVCGEQSWTGFTYNCSLCEYDVDIKCVLRDDALLSTFMDQYLNHQSHEHPLVLKRRPALFFCSACGTEDKDQSYSCTTGHCPFWIHRSCALLPDIKESKHHVHPLSLAYSFPLEYRHLGLNCDFCRKKLYLGYWVYHCIPCRYFLHVKCVDTNTSGEATQVGSTYDLGYGKEDKSHEHCKNYSIKLPGSDVYTVSQIFEELTRDLLMKYGVAQQLSVEIKHFSHMHPLTFSIGHQHDVKEMKTEEGLICDGCILPICDSYYSCKKCNYFLHTSCAQLPKEFQHPSHLEHPLVLTKLQTSFSYLKCSFCKLNCNGFLYECKVCRFRLDLKCATLDTVNVIMHEAHPHQLENSVWDGRCNGCYQWNNGGAFGCKDCNFHLHYNCAFLPSRITHFDSFRVYKRDNHPLTLMYPPFSDHPDDFYCEICEKEIHPKYWLYHCLECDRSFHSYCLVELGKYLNIKFGATLLVLNHKHPVQFIIRGAFAPFCECCDGNLYCQMAFECKDCSYFLCYSCAIKSHDFGSDIFKSSVDNMEMIVAEDSNSGFEDEAKAYSSINLPISDNSLELARHFLRRHCLTEPQLSAEIKHFSHKHPLNLSTDHQEDVKVLKNEDTLICDGCIRPISDPYYCCNDCNYFLHTYCVQLPDEIQTSSHSKHSLMLSKPLSCEWCRFCTTWCNGFIYKCKENNCYFHLDVHCAMLDASSFIMHEAHTHQLVSIDVHDGDEFACNACREYIFIKALSCEDCCFHLHYGCALLPRFVWHVKDKHPLILSWYSFEQHPKVIYCGICKGKICIIYWFYYCSKCNQSFHPRCISELFDDFKNLKFAIILQVLNHQHPLKLVRTDAFDCDQCGGRNLSLGFAYECESCGYYNCMRCVERTIGGNKLVEAPGKKTQA